MDEENSVLFGNEYCRFLEYLEKEFDLTSGQAVTLSMMTLHILPTLINENQLLKEFMSRNASYIKQ